jgi:pimeloyl-ACP methyl ester carboxylesterase
MMKPGNLEGALAYYRSSWKALLTPRAIFGRARPITAPTLVLWGAQDPALGVELTHGLERYVTGPLTIQYLRDVGHWTQQEAPEEVCAALEKFLLA